MRDDQWLGLLDARLNNPNAAAKVINKRKHRRQISELFLKDGDVAGAMARAARIVRP